MKNLYILLIYTFLIIPTAIKAQVNYKIHSLFVYKFTQYIEWPAGSNSGDFTIGVVGSSPIMAELEQIASSRKVGSQAIVVKKISANDAVKCQMVFVTESSNGQLSDILSKVKGKPILLVSETDGAGKKGAGINFIIVDDKMKFELNKNAITDQGLKVSGDLLKLAILL